MPGAIRTNSPNANFPPSDFFRQPPCLTSHPYPKHSPVFAIRCHSPVGNPRPGPRSQPWWFGAMASLNSPNSRLSGFSLDSPVFVDTPSEPGTPISQFRTRVSIYWPETAIGAPGRPAEAVVGRTPKGPATHGTPRPHHQRRRRSDRHASRPCIAPLLVRPEQPRSPIRTAGIRQLCLEVRASK